MTSDPVDAAREALNGYVTHGARYWPCAAGFTLVSLNANGETDGGGADICRECASTVASEALAIMDGAPLPWDPDSGPYGAVIKCGPAGAYDILGVNEFEFDTWCAQCGRFIHGFHLSEVMTSLPEPRFDRFDVAEAWWVLANEFGLYQTITRLKDRLQFSPRLSLRRYTDLSENGRAIYARHVRELAK